MPTYLKRETASLLELLVPNLLGVDYVTRRDVVVTTPEAASINY